MNDYDTDEVLPFAEYAIVWQKRLGQAITADRTSTEVIYQPSRQNLITFNDDFLGGIIIGNTQCKFDASGFIGFGDRYVDILIDSLDIKPETSPTNLLEDTLRTTYISEEGESQGYHYVAAGRKMNENYGFDFVQLEIQRKDDFSRYQILAIKIPQRFRHGNQVLTLDSICHEALGFSLSTTSN